ncbi:MAG: cytochrome c3 family protein [Pseudomonadota bacterium]
MAALAPTAAAAQTGALEKLLMPGRLIEGHADVESNCGACHDSTTDSAVAALCIDCHEDVGRDREQQTGYHGLFPAAARNQCIVCHTDHEGRDADIVGLNSGVFDHSFTDFPLRGAHEAASCNDCHKADDDFHAASSDCGSCHAGQDVHDGRLGSDCGECHSQDVWEEAVFDHASVGYALTGRHADVACGDCHRDNQFSATPRSCNSCHAIDDVHSGDNGTACADCHTTSTWSSIGFDHASETGFALEAGHGGLACADCHTRKDYKDDLSGGCTACHRGEDFHQGRNGTACSDCHTATRWSETTFDHDKTDFMLAGGHASLSCTACHKDDVQNELPTTCGTCHALDDTHGGQMGKDCGSCHSQIAWTAPVAFDHDLSTFPLTGLHAAAACGACHESNRFADAPSTCAQCHAQDDVHGGALGDSCGSCHNANGWTVTAFDHDTQTRFPLDGAHSSVGCDSCHRGDGQSAADVPATCGGCHASDDPHDGSFGLRCGDCHSTSTFSDVEQL